MDRKLVLSMLLVSFATAGLGACASHYKVTDPTSGAGYYTRDVDRDDGSVTFKDQRTETDVTLGNAQVKEVTEEEYTVGAGTK
jgi:hypothetical protein